MTIKAVETQAPPSIPSARMLGVFYFLYLGGLGSQASYLPLALQDRGLTLGEVSWVLTVPAIMRMIVPALWGFWADKRGSGGGLLAVACWGAALAYLPILWGGFGWAVLMLGVYSLFRLPISTLIDSLAFQRISQSGGHFGEMRRWGTVSYVLMVVASGYVATNISAEWAVNLGVVLMIAAALMAQKISQGAAPSKIKAVSWAAIKGLLSEPKFVLFLLAVMLHTVGQAGYDSYFSLHLKGLGVPAWVIGWAVALGAAVEVGVMSASGWMLRRFGAERVCIGAGLVAAARWWMNGHLEAVWALVAVQALHGITFGAWYVATAGLADQRAPNHLRASAQGLLSVASFGIGGAVAMLVGAALGDTGAFFSVASVLALCAAAVMAKSGTMRTT